MGVRVFVLRTLVALFAFASVCLPTNAFAGYVHPYIGSFGSFGYAQGVAVDSSTGDVYVYDSGKGELLKFDASGAPANFSSTGTNAITGVGGAGGGEGEIAVDNSAGPAKGDIYIPHADSSIYIYSSSGVKLGELTEEAGAPWGEPCGVAVDSKGAVYVGLYPSYVNKYVPSKSPVANADYSSSIGGLSNLCGVGADAAGDAYAVALGQGGITRYEPAQFGSLSGTGSVVDRQGNSMAIDPANEDVYADEGKQVAQFGAEGEPFEEPVLTFASSGEGGIEGSLGLAVSGFNGDIYVSNSQGPVKVFGPLVFLPDVATGSSSNLQSVSATVSGTINPEGVAVTECKFEYGPSAAYGQSQACAETPGEIGSGTSPVTVHADLAGLTPGATYHYRLVARNGEGAAHGTDQTFTLPGPPTVSSEIVVKVSQTEVDVRAQIDPGFRATTYRLEYGTNGTYGHSTGESQLTGSDGGSYPATVHVGGLTLGTTYHYRFVAINELGTTDGADKQFSTFSLPSTGGGCPNEARRKEQDATYLPDCRAYEMVSPLDKKGTDVAASRNNTVPSASGDRVFYSALSGFGEVTGSGLFGYTSYVATRKDGVGWSSHGVTPRPAADDYQVVIGASEVHPYSSSLESVLVQGYDMPNVTNDLQHNVNLYREDVDSGNLEALTTPIGVEPFSFEMLLAFMESLRGFASDDLGVETFASSANLMPGLPPGSKLYEWNHGKLEIAGVLPDGSFPAGGSRGATPETFSGRGEWTHSVSHDGSRVLFTAPADGSKPAQLYLRRNSTSTAWVSQSEGSTPVAEPKEVEFLDMSPDGSKVLFSTSDRLTDSDPGGEGAAIYLYTDGPNPEAEKNLTFIDRVLPGSYRGLHYDASQLYTTMSEDAKRIYFFTGAVGPLSQTGVYVWDEGTTQLVAPAAEPLYKGAEPDGNFTQSLAETSADGRFLAFVINEQLTEAPVGATEQEALEGRSTPAMYLYDEVSKSLTCVSCLPSGAPTTSAAAVIPKITNDPVGSGVRPTFLTRDGKYVFFNTSDALVPRDVNKLEDAYEYNTQTGTVSLLSSGTGGLPSGFAGASSDGSNVTIVSRRPFVAQDTDKLADVYDVRVDGGFPQPSPAVGSCVGDECQGVPSAAPNFSTASGFTGLGNVAKSPVTKAPSKKLSRAQKLARALRACKRKRGKARRHRCEVRARKRYGAKKASKSTALRARG